MESVTESICELLEKGEDLVLATVVNQKGSAPRASGAKMIVRSDGRIIGTIGGGGLEAEVIKAAFRIFKNKTAEITPFTLDGKLGQGLNSVCGGQIEALTEWMEAKHENLDFYRSLLAISAKNKAWLLTALPQPNSAVKNVRRCLIQDDGPAIGDVSLLESVPRRLIETGKSKKSSLLTFGDRSFWLEPIFPPATVYFFGAGHVAQQTAVIAGLTDFRTVVIDDREEFANFERFETADQILTPESFDVCFENLPIDQNSYIVILTRGHSHDRVVLAQALKTEAGYIGMIASRNKAKTIYEDLSGRGFSRNDLERVHSPVGLDIKAETPQEIAVSITAQLIAHRARQREL